MNIYTIYDWITSLLRPRSGSVCYKAIETPEDVAAASTATAAATTTATVAAVKPHVTVKSKSRTCGEAQHVHVDLIPTLNFNFQATATTTTTNSKAATSTDDAELAQHVAKTASATCAVNEDDADADNSSIRTYIVSSSFTTSSSTPYAVSSTDTAELLRQQNNLSLTEDEQTISSFSIEQPTSSMTIDMAEPQQQTATTTTRSEVTSSSDVLGRGATNNTTTTTTTTTSSSIEEEIEEALELSEGVEEQLRSNLDSTTDAKSSQAPREQSAKADSSEDAAQFRIDDAELSGGQLAQHFLVADDSDEEDEQEDEQQTLSEDDDDDDDDFDISLPLEGAKPVHSRHEESEEQPQGEESLSNQSTTDDVSDFVDEPQLVSSSAQLEQDHSLEEIVATNESIELSYEPEEHTISSTQQAEQLTDLDAVATPLTGSLQPLKLPQLQQPQLMEAKSARALETLQLQPERLELTMLDIADDSEEEECALQLMKLRLLALQQSQSQSQSQLELSGKASPTESPAPQVNLSGELKQMERVPMSEFSKDVLEDITEESERLLSLSTNAEEQQSLSIEESKTLLAAGKLASSSSVISLNMLQQLETQVQQLQQQLETKDNCLASLNLQLESARRETSTGPGSARDSSSLQTNSTEYRTLQEEYGAQTLDIYVELSRRDDMIAKLTESLQQSLGVREQLQTDAERLGGELQAMRRQLAEAMHKMKGSSDWEAQAGARLSEISMDLISESEDELAPHLPNDDDEHDLGVQPLPPEWPPAFSKQIEQFQKCLLPGELRPFLLVQRKFDDYLTQQLAQSKAEHAAELSRWQSEQQQSEATHTKQMEELRKYFEQRCADLEKQYSDEIFSHKSQQLGGDSSSECSEAEQLPLELPSKDSTPRKRKRAELLLSPSHRQLTPSGVDASKQCKDELEIAELKIFYQTHIHELKRGHEEQLRKLTERLRFYERRQVEDEDFVSTPTKLPPTCAEAATPAAAAGNTSLIIIDEDELNPNNESQVIQRIIAEYERRLQEQLALARQDIATELEQQIQSLLSESAANDQHWPKELILLREKFTAKSQLEITQLNIKHAEEMSRLKLEYEKQLNRKNKRHLTFDASRDLDNIISERDGLRELSKSFRHVLCRLAKCVANCEDDLNATLSEEVQRILTQSRGHESGEDVEHTLSSSLLQVSFNNTKRLVPDVHSLLELVEDPSLLQFIDSKSNEEQQEDFDLGDCLERLKSEAAYLLRLSEDLAPEVDEPEKQEHEQCCEAEDGLKTTAANGVLKILRTNSLNDQQLGEAHQRKSSQGVLLSKPHSSLPIDLQQHAGKAASELSFQLVELKNRLVKSETDRQKLQQQLSNTIDRNAELGHELQTLRDQLSQLNSLNHTDYAEGYGLGDMKSTPTQLDTSASFVQLQERARQLLISPTKQQQTQQSPDKPGNATVELLQMIEDFCREGDKVVECNKKDREDLQSQLTLVKQKHYAQLEAQLSEVNQKLAESNAKRDTFEVELKTSIDKIFMLREIISELETQVQTKSLNEQVLTEKSKQLEDYVQLQIRSNDALQQEVHSLKTDIGEGYQARIRQLEEKLQLERPSAEQSIVLTQLAEQLRDIETTLEQKTKTLESLHNSNTASNSCSLSATEDVSVHTKQPNMPRSAGGTPSPHHHSLTVEGVQRVSEKLDKHTRVEEAAIKRVRDLEMQVMQMRAGCVELQHERDSLQGRIDEQTERISTLQSRLEEQRQRAEQLHRAGTSDLNSRNHELQNELRNLSEQLAARDKQMAMLQQQLQRSKDEITRLEAELGQRSQPDRSLVQRLEAELQQLKEKMRNETVQRLAMPDLMETMLADKNDEIDHLQQQLEAKERELQAAKEQISPKQDVSGKHSGRTLSDIGSITEFPEPEVDRRAVQRSPSATLQLPDNAGGFLHQTMETSKEAVANLTYKRTDDLSGFVLAHPVNTFEHPHYFQDQHALGVTAQSSGNLTPGLVPRHINFSNLTEDSKLKTPCMLQQTPELPKALTPMPELLQLQQQLNDLEQQKQQQRTQLERNVAELKEQLQQQQQSEQQYKQRISALESKLLETAALEASERENLRRELNVVSAAHDQYVQQQQQTAAARQQQIETLTAELRSKTEQLQTVERELERLKHSEQSSRLYSVDEIAQQVEKELNYSAQLDSNIRKAIESEEENNLDHKLQQKEVQTDDEQVARTGHGTDDENFTGERELLNQLEALRAQLAVQREQCETMAQELHGEKLHSQDIQEQDVLIIEAMRKRLETVLDTEDELHKQLDMERERCERLQTQLTSLQRAESRRNSSMLKSPVDSPRKSPRADFESELSERLRSELKLLTAQNERERERSADAQRNSERERQRYEKELQERVAYCERLKQEMDKLARDKESAELELEHFNERLTLQANEIESLESRMVAMQEAETRRASTRTRQHQEQAKLQAELLELQSKLLAAESAKETLEQKIAQLRYDVTRSAQRETKLTEALAQANDRLAHSTEDTVPAQFLQKMKDINALLAENTQENRQMAETVQYLVGERIALQKKCEELGSNGVGELEERCRQLLGRYLRVESHRKALVYQKRYLKLTLESYQASEQLALQTLPGSQLPASQQQQRTKKKLFKTVALAIIAIQRIKYIGRIWHTGKRIVSKSVFTITQQRSAANMNANASAASNANLNLNNNLPTNANIGRSSKLCNGPIPYWRQLVNFSALQPIVLANDYSLQKPHCHNNNNNNNTNNNNNNKDNDSDLPTLAKLDWPIAQKPKRINARHH
ncbi:rootletin isoform X3 [Drosophila busckii]|uniref:rootletin isoform X3 n=1 Tax=Drosophila busckii TaxID=30019 RepID=UPI001432F89D|nr:rootletin isoform X3 [Drosophila busckii]